MSNARSGTRMSEDRQTGFQQERTVYLLSVSNLTVADFLFYVNILYKLSHCIKTIGYIRDFACVQCLEQYSWSYYFFVASMHSQCTCNHAPVQYWHQPHLGTLSRSNFTKSPSRPVSWQQPTSTFQVHSSDSSSLSPSSMLIIYIHLSRTCSSDKFIFTLVLLVLRSTVVSPTVVTKQLVCKVNTPG